MPTLYDIHCLNCGYERYHDIAPENCPQCKRRIRDWGRVAQIETKPNRLREPEKDMEGILGTRAFYTGVGSRTGLPKERPQLLASSPHTIAHFMARGLYFSVSCHRCNRYSEKQDMLILALQYGEDTDLYRMIFPKLICKGCGKKLDVTIGQEMIERGSIPKRH